MINRKGGAGKTTVTINLASDFATQSISTTIMDYDPEKFGRLRSFGMYVPPETRELIIDAPGGVSGVLLQELLCRANCVVIPVTPSSIDIDATAHFARALSARAQPDADRPANRLRRVREGRRDGQRHLRDGARVFGRGMQAVPNVYQLARPRDSMSGSRTW